jgi:hypothetical protein
VLSGGMKDICMGTFSTLWKKIKGSFGTFC